MRLGRLLARWNLIDADLSILHVRITKERVDHWRSIHTPRGRVGYRLDLAREVSIDGAFDHFTFSS